MPQGYDVAQICLNGHIINTSTIQQPEYSENYCHKCGERTITECEYCKTKIRGDYHNPPGLDFLPTPYFTRPNNCISCGKPFPWIAIKIQAAVELSKDMGELSDAEVIELKQNISDIITDNPKTQLGAQRFKKIMSKVGKETASAVRDIIVDIVSETAKKIIWSPK